MKTWTNPTVEELEVKLTARGFSDEGKEWDIWNPADGDNPWTEETPNPNPNPDPDPNPDYEYNPS